MNEGMKALIVDDEFHIRHGVRTSVSWEDIGVWEVEEAEDGNQAIALFDQHSYDIVVLDINIPGLTGIEVASHIRNSDNQAQIIFLTGYDDFPKVKEAIGLKASDYLLKPVSHGELLQALQKAARQVAETRKETGYVQQLKLTLDTYKHAAVDQLLLGFLQRRLSYADSVEFCAETDIMLGDDDTHGFLCTDIDHYEDMVAKLSEPDRHLYLYAYHKVAQEVVESESQANAGTNAVSGGYVLNLSESRMLVWLRFAERHAESVRADAALLVVAKRLQDAYREYLGMSVSIGISGTSGSLDRLHELHKEAVRAVEFRAVLGLGCIIPVRLLEPLGTSGQRLLAKELFVLGELRAGSGFQFQGILEEWIAELTHVPLPEARMIAAQLVVYAARLYAEIAGDQLRHVPEPLPALAGCETIEALACFMRNYITSLFEHIRSTQRKPVNNAIEQAKVWIRERIGEEISLQSLAAALHLNPYHVSRLFKQETGETYLEFTTKLRFAKARELLSGTPLKMHEIAEQVGFHDANYFSIAFKKHQGITPTDFRKRFQS